MLCVTDSNFVLFAAKHYETRHCIGDDDFEQDLKRFQYLKRLLTKYENTDEINVRLVLNNLVILYNCFGPRCTDMIWLKLEKYMSILKPFIVMLGYMPDRLVINREIVHTTEIELDKRVVEKLRKI